MQRGGGVVRQHLNGTLGDDLAAIQSGIDVVDGAARLLGARGEDRGGGVAAVEADLAVRARVGVGVGSLVVTACSNATRWFAAGDGEVLMSNPESGNPTRCIRLAQ